MNALSYHPPANSLANAYDGAGGIRKKTLSLGLNNIEMSPRKPLYHEQGKNSGRSEQKVSDFEKYLQHAKKHRHDAPASDIFGTDQQEQQQYDAHADEQQYEYDYHGEGVAKEDFNRALDLTSYKLDLDRHENGRLGAEPYAHDFDYNKFHKASPRDGAVKEKVLSLGVTSVHSNPRDLNAEERERRRKKYSEFQEKLKADQEAPIPQSRKSLVKPREYEDPKHSGTGFNIGSEHGGGREQKRAAQERYFEQLTNDRYSTEVSGDRKPFVRKNSPPAPLGANTTFMIGNPDDKKDQRARAEMVLRARRQDLLREMESPPRGKGVMAQEGVHLNAAEQMKFENAPYKYIGEYSDPESARRKKQSMQAQYMAQLLDDTRGVQPIASARGAEYEYEVDESQWMNKPSQTKGPASVGNIGYSEEMSPQQKHMRQTAYKRLLDQQRNHAADLARQEERRYGKL